MYKRPAIGIFSATIIHMNIHAPPDTTRIVPVVASE
jgi:hypothetical protein